MIEVGDRLPEVSLVTDTGDEVGLSGIGKAVVWFYPKAMTPGCTTEACDFRDAKTVLSEAGYSIFGVSPDAPEYNARFKEKESLNYPLLSDEDHKFAEAVGAWGAKKNYGKEYVGLIRSTLITDDTGVVTHMFRNVRAKGHGPRILKELGL
jgi:peroxiredoxin Q/BCP